MNEPQLLNETLQKIQFIYRCTGININIEERTRRDAIKCRCIYVLNFLWLNSTGLAALAWLMTGLMEGADLIGLTYIAPCLLLCFLGNFKTLFLIVNESNAHRLIGDLGDMEMKESQQTENDQKNGIISAERNFLHFVISGLNFLNASLLVAFAVNPLILMALNYYKTKELALPEPPFLINYPFDPHNIKCWPFVYLRQIWAEIVTVLNLCSVDYLFYTFCTYIRLQFRLLQHDIERIITPSNNLNTKVTFDNNFRTKFLDVIKWHQDIIRSVNLLEKMYTRSTLYNFVSSSVMICLAGFNATVNDDVATVITFISFLFISLLQIFFLCFFGDLLMRSSVEVSDAVYNCKWYLADVAVGKCLLIVQTRAQKPCKLTAYGYADVNLNAFTKILSTSWSYFALLRTIYSSRIE